MAGKTGKVARRAGKNDHDETDSKRDRFIILLRHGVAEPQSGSKPDQERSLTKAGHARMKEIARGLAEVFPKAEAIYSSPLLRCVQTALWVSKGYKSKLTPRAIDVLSPSGRADEVVAFVNGLSERRVILVGHEPTLSEDLRALTGIRGLELKKGGCYGVRIPEDGSATLEWLLAPRVLRRLAG